MSLHNAALTQTLVFDETSQGVPGLRRIWADRNSICILWYLSRSFPARAIRDHIFRARPRASWSDDDRIVSFPSHPDLSISMQIIDVNI